MGRLALSIVTPHANRGRTSQWADRKSWTLEEKLGEMFAELEVRAAEDRHRRAIEALEEEKREQRWAEELGGARERYLEHVRREELSKQVGLWRTAEEIRQFCAAVDEAHPEDNDATAWAAWAREYSERIDPLTHAPKGPSVRGDLHDYQLKDFIEDWSSSPRGHRSLW